MEVKHERINWRLSVHSTVIAFTCPRKMNAIASSFECHDQWKVIGLFGYQLAVPYKQMTGNKYF